MTVASEHLMRLGLELETLPERQSGNHPTWCFDLVPGPARCALVEIFQRESFRRMLNSTECFNISKSIPVGTPEQDC